MSRSLRFVLTVVALLLGGPDCRGETRLQVGSKAFTESVILGELASQVIGAEALPVTHRRELGGTRVLWSALLAGEIDAYPEYSGTLLQEIYAEREIHDMAQLRGALATQGLGLGAPLGFENTYALGVLPQLSASLNLRTISDLLRHPQLRLAFGSEFMDRDDGWPGLRAHYRLPHETVRGMNHDLAYRALADEAVDVIDLYSTDAEIAYYGLTTLADDKEFFPRYDAHWLYRLDLADRAPRALSALRRLEGRIDAAQMATMNAEVKLRGRTERAVAAAFLESQLDVRAKAATVTRVQRLVRTTLEHLHLVAISLSLAIALAIPLGIVAARSRILAQPVLAAAGLLQTVPSLALFVFMIPLLGIGERPAIAALFLYSLLPIVRNTYTGITDIPSPIRDSAEVMGLSRWNMLLWIELPLSTRAIFAGIKTAAVINVGTATLAALIGAGGYGQPILTGIRLDDLGLILEGAVPAALLALAVQGLFEASERILLPRSLRHGRRR